MNELFSRRTVGVAPIAGEAPIVGNKLQRPGRKGNIITMQNVARLDFSAIRYFECAFFFNAGYFNVWWSG